MINAGKYRHKIDVVQTEVLVDDYGHQREVPKQNGVVWSGYAFIRTTKGFTMLANDTNFERATTNFTIRYPHTPFSRDCRVVFNGRLSSIEYLNNIDEAGVELEMQCRELTH